MALGISWWRRKSVWAETIPWSGMYRTCVLETDAPRPRTGLSSPPSYTQHHRPSKPHPSLRLLLRRIDCFSWTLLERPRREGKWEFGFSLIKEETERWETPVLGRKRGAFSNSLPSWLGCYRTPYWFRMLHNSFIPSLYLSNGFTKLGGLFLIHENII
jgi:hypothetical protein